MNAILSPLVGSFRGEENAGSYYSNNVCSGPSDEDVMLLIFANHCLVCARKVKTLRGHHLERYSPCLSHRSIFILGVLDFVTNLACSEQVQYHS